MVPALFLIRILAILLIVNSHLTSFYPISAFSFGGHLGNSIFYLISGYGLSLSYQSERLPIIEWLKKRFLKILIPLMMILVILNIGNLKGLENDIWMQIIWHSPEQIEAFIPVLLALYILFLPLYSLVENQYSKYLVLFVICLSGIFFLFRMNSNELYKSDLPSEGIFFSFNALICFILGIIFSKVDLKLISRNLSFSRLILPIFIICSQIMHKIITIYFLPYVWINFYLNFICVAALFILLITTNFQLSKGSFNILKGIATSSLAVYLVHFKIIALTKHMGISYPSSIIFIFVHSFLWAYAVSLFINLITDNVLKKTLYSFSQ
jgi:hypothetical protein